MITRICVNVEEFRYVRKIAEYGICQIAYLHMTLDMGLQPHPHRPQIKNTLHLLECPLHGILVIVFSHDIVNAEIRVVEYEGITEVLCYILV